MVVCIPINRTVCDTLHELIVNATPKRYSVIPSQSLFFSGRSRTFGSSYGRNRGRQFPVRNPACKRFNCIHKAVFLELDKILEGGYTAETSRSPIPFADGNLQVAAFTGTVNIPRKTLQIAWRNALLEQNIDKLIAIELN